MTAPPRFLRHLLVVATTICSTVAGAYQINGTFSGPVGVNNANTIGPVTASYVSGLNISATSSNINNSVFAGTPTAINDVRLNSVGSPLAGFYAPDNLDVAATPALFYRVVGTGCAVGSGSGNICNQGTLTINFSRPITDPIMHISGFGGSSSGTNANSTTYDNRSQAIFNIATSGLTFSPLGNPNNLSVGTTRLTANSTDTGTSCVATTNNRGTTAGCGTVRINGTFSQLVFNMQLNQRRIFGSDTNLADDTNIPDAVSLAFTVNEDFGDAPPSYDPTAAASHVVGDLKLGATIDVENPNTLNGGTAVTPSPSAVAPGTDNTGVNGDGADEDAITAFPSLSTTSTSYSLTVPISGASAAGQVCGWVDYNRNGTFEVGERACAPFSAGASSVVLNWSGLSGLTAGKNYVRLRASYDTAGVQSPTGRLDSGEVEDYRLNITAPPLACTNTFYALLGDLTNGFRTIASLAPNGTVGATIATVPAQATNTNAALAMNSTGTKLFVATDVGTLEVFDVTSGEWVSSQPITGYTPSTGRLVRMAVTSNDIGYFSVGTQLWSFQTTSPYTITGPQTLTYTDTSNLTPAPTIVGSGDFFAGSGGNLYLSVNNGSNGSYLDTFKIRSDGTVTFIGRLNDPDIGTTDTYGGFAAIGSTIYGSSAAGRIIAVDLANLSVAQSAPPLAARGNSDLTSCSYPILDPSVAAIKTAAKVAGSAGSNVVAGDTLEYTIVVRNSGNIAAPGTMFSDAIPAGSTYVSGSTTLNGVAVADSGGVMPYAVAGGAAIQSPNESAGNLRADATPANTTDREATIKFRVIVSAGVQQVSNQGTVTYVDAPSTILTDSDSVAPGAQATVTTVTLIADLAIDKSGPVAVGGGGSVTYTIRVWNNGPSSVTGASVTDALPAGFTVTALTCAATGTATCGSQTFPGNVVTITTGTLSVDTNTANATPDGNFLTYTLTGTATASGTLSNTASVTVPAGAADPTPANNTSAAAVTQIVDAVNDANVNVTFGTGATFPVLANDKVGAATATTGNVAVTITNAGGLTGLSVNGNGELVLAASLTNLPGTYTVTYQICSTTTTTACDTATQTITVTPAAADLGIVKSQRLGTTGTFQTTPLSVTQGSTVQYQIVVTNSGPSAVTNSTFTDAVPANLTGLSVVSAAGTGTTCTASFTGSTLNGSFSGSTGQTCTVTIQGTATTTGTFTNTATVTAPSGITDATTGNNSSSVNTTVTPAADLAIDKSGPLAVGSGGAVSYTIRVWNNGPSSVTGASVTDALPAGFTVTALTCAATGTATCGTQTSTASSVTITTGTLSLDTNTANATPDGNFLTYTLTGTASASSTLSNTASVTAPAGTTDLRPDNNTSGAVTTRVIDAVTDSAVNFGFGAGGTVTVLGNDTVGGAVATTTNATVTVQNNGGITGLTVNAGGQLVVPAGTPAGTYTVTYQLCDAAVTAACDTATVQVTVNAAATSDLAVSKTGPAFAQPGGTVTYTIRAWNNGTSASSATVTDTVPADLTGVSWTCAGAGGATCAAPSGTGNNVSVGATLPVDTGAATTADTAFVTVTVTATAPSTATLSSTPAARTITNTASVSGPNTDPTPANNSASAVTNMVYGKLTKEVRNVTTNTAFGTSGGGLPSEILEYCIAFENLGGAALPNFVVVDHVPGNTNALTTAYDADEPSVTTGFGVKLTRSALTSYLSSSAADTDGGSLTTAGGTFTRGTMTVSLGTLAPGESGRTCFQTTIR